MNNHLHLSRRHYHLSNRQTGTEVLMESVQLAITNQIKKAALLT